MKSKALSMEPGTRQCSIHFVIIISYYSTLPVMVPNNLQEQSGLLKNLLQQTFYWGSIS